MSRIYRLAVGVALLAAAGLGIRAASLGHRLWTLAAVDNRPVPLHRKPYTVVLKAMFYAGGKPPQLRWEETHAVRRDGSFMVSYHGVDAGLPFAKREIYLLPSFSVVTNDVQELKTTGLLTDRSPRWRDPNAQCLSEAGARERIVGEDSIAGFRVIKIRSGLSLTSYAVDLECAILRGEGNNGSKGQMIKELVSVAPGDPDSGLFDVPPHYAESPPSVRVGVPEQSETGKKMDLGYKRATKQ